MRDAAVPVASRVRGAAYAKSRMRPASEVQAKHWGSKARLPPQGSWAYAACGVPAQGHIRGYLTPGLSQPRCKRESSTRGFLPWRGGLMGRCDYWHCKSKPEWPVFVAGVAPVPASKSSASSLKSHMRATADPNPGPRCQLAVNQAPALTPAGSPFRCFRGPWHAGGRFLPCALSAGVPGNHGNPARLKSKAANVAIRSCAMARRNGT